jgi:hypothetical protein
MKEIKEYEKDLASIRSMMERSVKFISLSGLSGVLAGVYALLGAVAAYYVIHYPGTPFQQSDYSTLEIDVIYKILAIAAAVLLVSVATGIFFSNRKAKKHNVVFWNTASKQMVFNISIPLVSGGIFILILLANGHAGLAIPATLVFYGLSLIQGSTNTFDEVRYLGYFEIVLGLMATALPGYGLLFWAAGFGVLHIVYGLIMYNKYDR